MHSRRKKRTHVEVGAADVVPHDVEALGRKGLEGLTRVGGLVVEGLVKAHALQHRHLLVRPCAADDAAALDLQDLARHEAHGAGGAIDPGHLALLGLRNARDGEVGAQARHAQRAQEGRGRDLLQHGRVKLAQRVAGHRLLEDPRQAARHSIALGQPVKLGLDDHRGDTPRHGLAHLERVRIALGTDVHPSCERGAARVRGGARVSASPELDAGARRGPLRHQRLARTPAGERTSPLAGHRLTSQSTIA